jgi:hypothetical protein
MSTKSLHNLWLGAAIVTIGSAIWGSLGFTVDFGRGGGEIITNGEPRATIIVGLLAVLFTYLTYKTRVE